MKIATWNISSGIDMTNFNGELFDKKPEISTDDKCLNQIAEAIKKNNIDIIALQEVTTTNSFLFMEKLSKLTGLMYFEKFENSPGFLIENTSIGLAILSRYPIKCEVKEYFKNPKLIKETQNGTYTTHDKAFVCVSLKDNPSFKLISTQFLPFHRFNANILDYKETFENFENYIAKNNVIVCGDFNVITGKENLLKLLNKTAITHNFIFDEITTTDNKKCDNILINKNIKIKNSYLEKTITPSDHFMCVIEI